MKSIWKILVILTTLIAFGCQQAAEKQSNSNETATTKEIAVVQIPSSIAEKIKARGEQEDAKPELIVEAPKDGATIESSTVKVKVKVAGDLKGYAMGKADDGTGNHVHVILDNQPYTAHYMWDEGFELRNVTDGEHTLRMFPSRPWHQSYKNAAALKVLKFTVKNGKADTAKPTTDSSGKKLADAAEGADVQESIAGNVDFSKPLLTYSRPKGTYKGEDAKVIMIDFWLSNAKLKDDGGEFVVKYSINGGQVNKISKWEPVWISGWKTGKNTIKLWLIDGEGNAVKNGGYNSTEREIMVE